MKKTFFIPVLALLALAGCNKPEEQDLEFQNVPETKEATIPEGSFAFMAGMGSETKATLNSDNTLYWASGDQIAAYSYGDEAGGYVKAQDCDLIGGAGTASGTFIPSDASALSVWFNAASTNYHFYAWYPVIGDVVSAAATPTVSNVTASQSEAEGIGKYIICYASSTTTSTVLSGGTAPSFSFSPVTALLKLTIKNSSALPTKISSLTVTAASGYLAGNTTLTLADGSLSAGSSASVTYTPSAPIEIAAGASTTVPVAISVLPCSPGSLTVSFQEEGFVYNEPSITLATIEAGHVYAKTATITSVTRKISFTNSLSGTKATTDLLEANNLYYGSANSIVMAPNATSDAIDIRLYKSDATFARGSAASTHVSAATSAKVIWAESDLYYDKGFYINSSASSVNQINIVKTAGVTGNALVGIYSDAAASDANLLWSFHVWCPADASVVNVTSEKTSTNFTAYKLALGQISSDSDTYMYYQWGRKDPLGRTNPGFGGGKLAFYNATGSSSTVGTVANVGGTGNNLANARQNPTNHVSRAGTNTYDWYPGEDTNDDSHRNNNLWSSSSNTIYDPCPKGYHVAPKALWDGTAAKEAGDFYSAGLHYVLGGNLYTTGGLDNVGSNGHYWSSEFVAGNRSAYYLYFNASTTLNRENDSNRANGFGVRCVKN